MNTAPQWVATSLDSEKIHDHSVLVKDKAGREIQGRLEVAMVNDRGESVVRACYHLNPDSKRASLAAFYLSQEQMDAFAREGEQCVLTAPVSPSKWR
jgi:hypothetical protein